MPIHLVTGTGGSGVTATAAALALGQEAPATLAAARDDGSLARWSGQPADAVLDLSAAPALQSAEELLGGLMEQYGGDGVVAEEWRYLPGADVLAAVVEFGAFAAGDDVLVVDLGDLHRAADLLSAVTRLPWALRHLLGLQAVWTRVLGGAMARGIPQSLDALEAARDLLTDEGTRLHVVVSADGGSHAKARRLVPGLLLSGVAPGLLVETGAAADTGGDGWAPFTYVGVPAPRARPGRTGDGTDGTDARAELDNGGAARGWQAAAPLAAAAAALPGVPTLRPTRTVTRSGNELTWRLPLPWVRAADLRLEHREDDLIVTVHGVPHLVLPPAVVRRSIPTAAVVESGHLIVTATLREGAWRR